MGVIKWQEISRRERRKLERRMDELKELNDEELYEVMCRASKKAIDVSGKKRKKLLERVELAGTIIGVREGELRRIRRSREQRESEVSAYEMPPALGVVFGWGGILLVLIGLIIGNLWVIATGIGAGAVVGFLIHKETKSHKRKQKKEEEIKKRKEREQERKRLEKLNQYEGRMKRWRLKTVFEEMRSVYSYLLPKREMEEIRERWIGDYEPWWVPEVPPDISEEEAEEIGRKAAGFAGEKLGEVEGKLAEKIEGGAVSLGRIESLIDAPGKDFIYASKYGWEEEIPERVPLELEYDLWQIPDVRTHHTYIVGKTGYGKTNLIRHLLLQDMEAGKGVGVLTPEADLIRDKILPFIPEKRLEDVIYFNPGDEERLIPFNPFHVDEGEDIHVKAEEVYTIFKRAMPELTGARMAALLRHSIYSLVEREGSTVLDLLKLWSPDSRLRDEIIATTKDQATEDFWKNDYPDFSRKSYLPLKNRLAGFMRPPISTMLAHSEKSFNFREAMDEGKILLFELSGALRGERSSKLLGQLIVTKMQHAVLSREDISEPERVPFYFYIDEFQEFVHEAEAAYRKLLTRARKYKMGLYLTHQRTEDIPRKILSQVKGASTIVVLNVDAKDASRLRKDLFLKDSKILQKLGKGEAGVKIGNSSYQMYTPLMEREPDWELQNQAIHRSRRNYGVPVAELKTEEPSEKEDWSREEGEEFLE